jgi:hypothetical protein
VLCGPGEVSRPSRADATGLTCEDTAADRRPDSSMAVDPACAQAGGWPHRTVTSWSARCATRHQEVTTCPTTCTAPSAPTASARLRNASPASLGPRSSFLAKTLLVVVWIAPNAIGQPALGPLSVHPAQSCVLHPGRVRRTADLARPDPAGRPRQGRGRQHRPDRRRAASPRRGAEQRTAVQAPRWRSKKRLEWAVQGHFNAPAKRLRAEHRRPHADRPTHGQFRPSDGRAVSPNRALEHRERCFALGKLATMADHRLIAPPKEH